MSNDNGALVVIEEGTDVALQLEAFSCCWAVFVFTF